jgi:hypothetical protein
MKKEDGRTLADAPNKGLGGFEEAGGIEPGALDEERSNVISEPARRDHPIADARAASNSGNEAVT